MQIDEDLTLATAKLMHVKRVLEMDFKNRHEVAKALGISSRSLRHQVAKIREFGIEIDDRHEETEEIKVRVGLFATNKQRIEHMDKMGSK